MPPSRSRAAEPGAVLVGAVLVDGALLVLGVLVDEGEVEVGAELVLGAPEVLVGATEVDGAGAVDVEVVALLLQPLIRPTPTTAAAARIRR
jgi:hypothetical protein